MQRCAPAARMISATIRSRCLMTSVLSLLAGSRQGGGPAAVLRVTVENCRPSAYPPLLYSRTTIQSPLLGPGASFQPAFSCNVQPSPEIVLPVGFAAARMTTPVTFASGRFMSTPPDWTWRTPHSSETFADPKTWPTPGKLSTPLGS